MCGRAGGQTRVWWIVPDGTRVKLPGPTGRIHPRQVLNRIYHEKSIQVEIAIYIQKSIR